jgi:hypothetical protein
VSDSYDHLQTRCPRLGSVVPFHYCRSGAGEPCFKVLDCWWQQFDVAAHFRRHLGEEAFQRLVSAPGPDKMKSLVDLIRQAQERTRESSESS